MWPPPSFERVHARACTLLRMRTESRWRATSYPTLLANRARWVNALAMSACAAAIDLYLVTVSAYRRAISATAADLTDLSALSVASAASKAARSMPALRNAARYDAIASSFDVAPFVAVALLRPFGLAAASLSHACACALKASSGWAARAPNASVSVLKSCSAVLAPAA